MHDFILKTKGASEASLYIGSIDNPAFLNYALVTDQSSLLTALTSDKNILVHITTNNPSNKAIYDYIFEFATGQILYNNLAIPANKQDLSLIISLDLKTLKLEELEGRIWRNITALSYQD